MDDSAVKANIQKATDALKASYTSLQPKHLMSAHDLKNFLRSLHEGDSTAQRRLYALAQDFPELKQPYEMISMFLTAGTGLNSEDKARVELPFKYLAVAKHWRIVSFQKEEMDSGMGNLFEIEAQFYFGTVMPNNKAILIRKQEGDITQYYCSSTWEFPGPPKGKFWEPAKLATRFGIQVIYPAAYDLDEWLP